MNAILIKAQADIAAIQARIEAMKAQNAYCAIQERNPDYDANFFFNCELELQEISNYLKAYL